MVDINIVKPELAYMPVVNLNTVQPEVDTITRMDKIMNTVQPEVNI